MRKPDEVELLITRSLDGELTPADRRRLDRALREDEQAAVLFDELRALDREVSNALHAAAGRRLVVRRLPRTRLPSLLGVAAAACLATLFWRPGTAPLMEHAEPRAAQASALFMTHPALGDSLRDAPARPAAAPRKRPDAGPSREWIVVPASGNDQFLVVEVRRMPPRKPVARPADF